MSSLKVTLEGGSDETGKDVRRYCEQLADRRCCPNELMIVRCYRVI